MKKIFVMTVMLMVTLAMEAQNKNTAFKAGETLQYDLYFNWKFIWMKCGTADYKMTKEKYNGKETYHNYLIFRTNKKFDGIFTLRDTLDCYMQTSDLRPLYFKKASLEGKKHRLEEVWYNYPGGKRTHIKQRYINPYFEEKLSESDHEEGVYDMMSLMAFARSLSADGLKVGQRLTFPMTANVHVETQRLIYKGKENFKANDGNTYRCLVFSLLDWEDTKKDKELLRLYLSDDNNHLPLRIDFFLKFGSAKAFFSSGSNLLHPLDCIVKKKK